MYLYTCCNDDCVQIVDKGRRKRKLLQNEMPLQHELNEDVMDDGDIDRQDTRCYCSCWRPHFRTKIFCYVSVSARMY